MFRSGHSFLPVQQARQGRRVLSDPPPGFASVHGSTTARAGNSALRIVLVSTTPATDKAINMGTEMMDSEASDFR